MKKINCSKANDLQRNMLQNLPFYFILFIYPIYIAAQLKKSYSGQHTTTCEIVKIISCWIIQNGNLYVMML